MSLGRGAAETDETYRAYRKELHDLQMPVYAKTTAIVVAVVNVFFVWLDYYAFPSQFATFFTVRLLLQAVVVVVFLRADQMNPVAEKWTLYLATGTMLVIVVYGSGGPTTEYYAGLILLFTGIPVLLPMTWREVTLGSSIFLTLYWISPVFTDTELDTEKFTVHSLFLLSAAFVSAASAHRFDQTRFNDFRRRKEVESARDELKELDRAKSRFTANIHHELRTPLTLLLAPLEAMLGGTYGKVPEGFQNELESMRGNALRLLRLISDLLELAKIEGDARQLRIEKIELPEKLGRLVRETRPLADRKGLEISLDIDRDVPQIFVDPQALDKIAVNLISNSLKFTPSGGTIAVRVRSYGSGVELSVQDNGIGIPGSDLQRVFDRFAQVDASATRSHEGTGIGLSLVKELVELHGGEISAESPGHNLGTTMRVRLPVNSKPDVSHDIGPREGERSAEAEANSWALGALEAYAGRDEAAEGPNATDLNDFPVNGKSGEDSEGTHPEVLVVEDNPEMRRLLGRLLESEFVVRMARNGIEARDEVNERRPTVVVTDVMMPKMSGTELCRLLKSDESTQGIPVVLITSKAEREMKIEGLEMGADDYVTKPFHPRELLARVRSLARLRLLQDEIALQKSELEKSNAELVRALGDLKETEVQLVQAERLAAVGELSAGVAHEVNNPLNFARNAVGALRTYAEELIEVAGRVKELELDDPVRLRAQVDEWERQETQVELDRIGGDLRELVGIIGEGLDRTARLVGDLRDFAAPDRGPEVRIDIGAGLESTLELVGHRLRDAGARVTAEIEPGLPSVLGDPGAINQVFLNVLKNSADAIEGKGGGEIEVVARREGAEAVVRVRDDGPGVDSDVQARLFEPFFTTKSAGRGTGLGLSICRRIVEQHGGRIEVDSVPGAGATVVVRLPEGDSGAA